jgi:ribosomal protein L11 methylase PrmA
MTSPILKAIAGHLGADGPAEMVLSGILPNELDEVAAAFAPAGLAKQDRRQMGDWAALLLRRPR